MTEFSPVARPPGSLAGERPQTRVQDWFGAWTNEDNEPPKLECLEHGMAFRLQSVAWCFVEAWGGNPVHVVETLLVGGDHSSARTGPDPPPCGGISQLIFISAQTAMIALTD